jgi:hypothetical protein
VLHLENLAEAEDGVKGRAEFMTHAGQELTLRKIGSLRSMACLLSGMAGNIQAS